MATFDRFDICEAWYIFLANNHGGQGSREYARLSRLQVSFKPRGSLRGAEDLSPNGLEIYLDLVGNELPVVDEGEGNTIYEMWAGAYACTKCLVRADSFESAFEAFAEWLDDNAPGCLTAIDYDDAARECGFTDLAAAELAGELDRVVEHAETDMTTIGHTTLDNGNAIPSWEWGGQEVSL